MTMRPAIPLALACATLLLAGCLSAESGGDRGAGAAGPGGGGAAPGGDWAALESAVVRPGVPVTSAAGSCTSNFVFRSPDNATLYLGLAAHCLEGESEGERVQIAGQVEATVAYNSWYTMDHHGDGGADREANDFALLEIAAADRHLVHPAVLHYGGPVALATTASAGDRIVTYGDSPLRQGLEPSNSREGYLLDATPWYMRMYIVTPGIPGDSGSGVLNGQGEALGVLIHLGLAPYAASNGAVNLATALRFAAEHGGLEAELATWETLDPGVFPDPP